MTPQLVIVIGQCVIRMQYFRNRRASDVVSYWKVAKDNKIKKGIERVTKKNDMKIPLRHESFT